MIIIQFVQRLHRESLVFRTAHGGILNACRFKQYPHLVHLMIISDFTPLISSFEICTIEYIFVIYNGLKLIGCPRFIFYSLSWDLN